MATIFEMWEAGGEEKLSANTREEAMAEMDRDFPWWRDENTETALHESDYARRISRLILPDGTVGNWDRWLEQIEPEE